VKQIQIALKIKKTPTTSQASPNPSNSQEQHPLQLTLPQLDSQASPKGSVQNQLESTQTELKKAKEALSLMMEKMVVLQQKLEEKTLEYEAAQAVIGILRKRLADVLQTRPQNKTKIPEKSNFNSIPNSTPDGAQIQAMSPAHGTGTFCGALLPNQKSKDRDIQKK